MISSEADISASSVMACDGGITESVDMGGRPHGGLIDILWGTRLSSRAFISFSHPYDKLRYASEAI